MILQKQQAYLKYEFFTIKLSHLVQSFVTIQVLDPVTGHQSIHGLWILDV
jgi:hypothetical protein